MPGLFQHPLASRVGRRLALVVVVASLVPLAIFGSLVFSRARAQVDTQERLHLHQDTKTAALNGLARLTLLEQGLRWLASEMADGGNHDARLTSLPILADVQALAVFSPAVGWRPVRGAATPPALDGARSRHLAQHGAVLAPGATARTHWMVVAAGPAQVAALVPMAAVFGVGEGSSLPPRNVFCLKDDAGTVVGCSNEDAETMSTVGAAALPVHGEGTLSVAGGVFFARTWTLPLQAEFGTGVWTAIMLTPQADAYATLGLLQRDAVLMALASLIVVILAVLAAVRRNLRPLAALEAAAARVGRQQFDVSLAVSTGDEFETLADGFNSMVTAIRAHVAGLEAFSVGAATALARTIDAKSPWTSGHSERVTALALRIAGELAVSADELILLQRGGLLHDIGKLATPPEILDKAGRLTPDERARIQQHPRDGVRILEPIAEFAPLLPLVLEHHERYDGAGYPDGKAGEQIHRLARVLAVADVYDALASERPYRAGLPAAAAVDYIRAASGTHFDPAVVEAFLRVAAVDAAGAVTRRRAS
jgi:putative nucleotidyltransferase with HDIG domain